MTRKRIDAPVFGLDFNVEPLWCAWFAGLVDGEGCFTIRAIRGQPERVELKVALRADEKEVLNEIKMRLKCGHICAMSNRSARLHGKLGADGLQYRVSAINEVCNIIIPLIDKYPLRTRKQKRYLKWREAALMFQQGQHLKDGKTSILKLKMEITAEGKRSLRND